MKKAPFPAVLTVPSDTPILGNIAKEAPSLIVPGANKLKIPSQDDILRHFSLFLAYAMFEKANETEVTLALTALVEERHLKFHDAIKTPNWRGCKNQKCNAVREMIDKQREMSLTLHPMSAELMEKRYNIQVKPLPGGVLKAYLTEANSLTAVRTQPQESESKLIIPG